MRTFNCLDQVVPYLVNPSLELLDSAKNITRLREELIAHEFPKEEFEELLMTKTKKLVALVRASYTDSEVETADVQCNRCNGADIFPTSMRAGTGRDRVTLAIDNAGSSIRYATTDQEVTAYAFIRYDLNSGQAIILLVDGGYGYSITNSADQLIPFLQREYIGRRGIKWRNVRVVYRDTTGVWDEIVIEHFDGGQFAQIGFRPLGERRLDDALAAAAAVNLPLDGHDQQHLRNAIKRATSLKPAMD